MEILALSTLSESQKNSLLLSGSRCPLRRGRQTTGKGQPPTGHCIQKGRELRDGLGWVGVTAHQQQLEFKLTFQSPRKLVKKKVRKRGKAGDSGEFVLLPSGFFL